MLGERVVQQSEVIGAILLEGSQCCGVPRTGGKSAQDLVRTAWQCA